MTFTVTSNVKVKKDEDGNVKNLQHPRQPYQPEIAPPRAFNANANGGPAETDSLILLADNYLKDVMPTYGLDHSVVDDLQGAVGEAPSTEASKLRFLNMEKVGKQAVVAYTQTELGLPVWESGMSVKILRDPDRVVSSKSTVHRDIDVQPPPPDSPYFPAMITPETLAQLLRLGQNQTPKINGTHMLIYKLDPEFRGNGAGQRGQDDETQMHVANPTLQLPELATTLVAGRYYVVTEILFTLKLPDGDLNWRALIEPQTGSVLRLEVFVGCLDGYVFLADPLTKTGNQNIRADSVTEILNQQRDQVSLPGLNSTSPQELCGKYCCVRNVQAPNVLPPTQPRDSPFFYSVPTDDFSAVNAYYHCDRLFRMLEEMGINVEEYFDGTQFPVPCDHRVSYGNPPTANIVNASAPGDADGDGSGGFRFALVQRNTNVGMAVEWRVILHEFGHAIMWDHVNSPNFTFAHSPGDSLAAILVDPDSKVPDRYRTFPWTIIRRRHDRRVEDGWGWGGTVDDPIPVGFPWGGDPAGYNREQILSTTLFRYYRAIGGDHSDRDMRTQASRYAAYVIFLAVGLLTRVTQPGDAEDFADELMQAEESIDVFEGLPGGTTSKVIRWAFERQGLYQRPGRRRATVAPGFPPKVDVYIDDGRNGEYDPRPSFVFSSTDIWNRNQADNELGHQQPVSGQSNFLYVRVKNRGTAEAENVVVKAYINTEGGERIWPSTWTALDTASVAAKGSIPSKGETVVGPFTWTRSNNSSVAVLAIVSADDDEGTAESVNNPISIVRLTHCDNNVAGRILNVVSGTTPTGASEINVDIRPLLTIPDADPVGVVSDLDVSESGTISEVNASVSIMHTYIGDLLINLESPSGTSIVLFEGKRIDSTDNLITTFTPETVNALNDFKGENALGSWKLRVVDRSGLDEGSLVQWGLVIKIAT